MGFLLAAMTCVPSNISELVHEELKSKREYVTDKTIQRRCSGSVQCEEPSLFSRRGSLKCLGASLVAVVAFNDVIPPLTALAEGEGSQKDEELGIAAAFKSLFDPNEKTKSGKMLPKAYLKSAREVVKSLRESLQEDPKDITQFRRTADAAKQSIRDYLSNWRGQVTVTHEESYAELERVIRSLATFYSKAGPSAPLPGEIKSKILEHLSRAEEFL